MSKLPKSIIRKYGISKEAWEVFRGKKSTKRSAPPTTKKKASRRARTVRYVKKQYRSRGGARGIAGGFMNWAIGGLGLAASRKVIQPMTSGMLPAIAVEPVNKLAVGLVLKQPDMTTVGIKEAIANLAEGYLGGSSASASADAV